MFSNLSQTEITILQISNLSSAIAFNLVYSKILLFGNKSTFHGDIKYGLVDTKDKCVCLM